MSSPHVLSDREQALLTLVDRSISLAERDYDAGADMPAARTDQYEMILRNLKNLRDSVAAGRESVAGGFSRFADEWGPLSDDLMDSFRRFEAFMQDEF
jgi:hypothetical protein